MRAQSDAGPLFFKASLSLPIFSDESRVIPKLATHYPGQVPQVLAADVTRNWILLANFGPPILSAPPDVWEGLFASFGRLQRDAAGHVGDLMAAGCRRADMSRVTDRVMALTCDGEDGERLRGLAPRLAEMTAELLAFRVPPSLVHGDLHLANVARHDGKYLVFDWADCAIAHPFLDLAYIFAEGPANPQRCRDAYLATWSDYEDPTQLRRMWDLAEPLSALHQAFAYQETAAILAEPAKRQFLGGVTYFVRQLLKSAVFN